MPVGVDEQDCVGSLVVGQGNRVPIRAKPTNTDTDRLGVCGDRNPLFRIENGYGTTLLNGRVTTIRCEKYPYFVKRLVGGLDLLCLLTIEVPPRNARRVRNYPLVILVYLALVYRGSPVRCDNEG